jgi:hypothetical protein
LQLEDARQQRNRPLGLAAAAMDVRQVIRPARIVRHQRLRVEIRGLGGVVVLRRVQQHRVFAVGGTELTVRDVRA